MIAEAPPAHTRRPNHTLERRYYTAPEVFEADMEKIFLGHWLYAGHESQIPHAGDWITYETAGESVIIARQADGSVRAFFNVCRHRGARLASAPCGHAANFRCGYHNWIFGLDGALRTAPGLNATLRREDHALIPARVEVWHGLVYVHLGAEAPAKSVAELLAGAEAAMAPFRFRDAKVARTISYEVASNWKLFMENYRECYHCLANHPEFCATVPVGRGVALHQGSRNIRLIHAPSLTFSNYPLRAGAKTQSLDGAPVSLPFGDLTFDDPVPNLYLNFYPAHGLVLNADYAMAFSVHPRDALRTTLKVDWLVNARAVAGRDYDPDTLVKFWDVTHRQDLALCAMNQQGVNSRRYIPGPYSPEEDDVDHLLTFYVDALNRAGPAYA
jgi:Rieske 2Fe-2S family protein